LTDDEKILPDVVRRIVQDKITPKAEEIDAREEFSHGIIELFREVDLLGLPFIRFEVKKENGFTCC
jgi:hypothetical protein